MASSDNLFNNSVLTPQIWMSEVFQVLATFPNKLPWIELVHQGILHALCTKKRQAVRHLALSSTLVSTEIPDSRKAHFIQAF